MRDSESRTEYQGVGTTTAAASTHAQLRSSGHPGRYVGRFAPSPTGLLHEGSVVAALASWLDARAHRGTWLVRIEDIDPPREVPGAGGAILEQLAALGLHPDDAPVRQSGRHDAYDTAFGTLRRHGVVYGCGCTRRELALAAAAEHAASRPDGEIRYPGTCRHGLAADRAPRAWRFRIDDAGPVAFDDRWLGPQRQQPAIECGDFVVRRADGPWAYQLAVVVDDGAQQVTDIVRGADLLTSTGRQILLQRALGLPTPRYLHVPVVLGANGRKLSKQNGAAPVDTSDPLRTLGRAMQVLGLDPPGRAHAGHAPGTAFRPGRSITTAELDTWLAEATARWARALPRPDGVRAT